MKKVIFILALAVILTCLLVVTAGAEVTTYKDAPVKTNIIVSTDDLTLFDDGFCCPTGYVFKDITAIPDGKWGSPALANCFDFSYIEEKTGKKYEFSNVYEIDLPQGLTKIGTYMAQGVNTLRKVSIPNSVTSIGNCTFELAKGLEECIFEHDESSTITAFPSYMFTETALKAFSMPDCFTTMNGVSQFARCKSLTALHLSKNLTRIEGGSQTLATFDNCNNMYFVNEAFTNDNIPQKPEVYYFPENLEFLSDTCVFRWCHNLNNIMVFGTKITSVPNRYTFENKTANTIVFLGDMTNVNANNWGSTTLLFANKADLSENSIETLVGAQTKIFCYAEGNVTHLSEKVVDVEARCEVNAAKVTYCFCGQEVSRVSVEGSAISHDYDYINNENAKLISITYTSYAQKGEKTISCANCGESCVFVAPALFVAQGYSAQIQGGCGFAIGFAVNNKAISEYTEFTKVTVSFGFFAVLKDRLGRNDIIGENSVFADGVVKNDMTKKGFDIIEFKLKGFTTEEQMAKKIALGIYVIASNDTEQNVSYLQVGTANEGEKYAFVSYNDLVA